jgi:hypothetical protein
MSVQLLLSRHDSAPLSPNLIFSDHPYANKSVLSGLSLVGFLALGITPGGPPWQNQVRRYSPTMPSTKPSKRIIRSTCPVLPIETPIIPTLRLILRPLLRSDLAIYHKIRSSPAVMRYSQLQRPDVDVAFTKTKLDPSLAPQNRADGTLTYLFGVEERSNPGVLIGDMGCHDANPGNGRSWVHVTG